MAISKKNKLTKKNKYVFPVIKVLLIILVFTCGLIAYRYYTRIFSPNVHLNNKQYDYLFIPTGTDFNHAIAYILQKGYVVDIESFIWVAKKKNYKNHIHPGKYKIISGMSNNELINHLRSGNQETVKLIFNYLRTKEQLASRISRQIEADSLSIIKLLNNDSTARLFGFDSYSFMSMFIPNTYEFYWNTSAMEFLKRMEKEYKKFWTQSRIEKADEIGLTPQQVSILASIIEEETVKNEEKSRIAGVYINRLKKGKKLEADPTVKFAWGDFFIRRILRKHLGINSPYNTYKFYGLPPGPISIPSIITIDAVLNCENHDFLYFCAKDDFSGYHVFAKTLKQHIINARKYQYALNKKILHV
jgi:UPF0755 protein